MSFSYVLVLLYCINIILILYYYCCTSTHFRLRIRTLLERDWVANVPTYECCSPTKQHARVSLEALLGVFHPPRLDRQQGSYITFIIIAKSGT